MRKLIISVFIILSLSGCGTQAQQQQWKMEQEARNYNPCTDPRFLALRDKPIDSLTMREYDFLKQKEQECNKYLESEHTSSPFVTAVLITLGVLAVFWVVNKSGL
jgi:PBP1b-binding outer membrane lipoprotein LpoB